MPTGKTTGSNMMKRIPALLLALLLALPVFSPAFAEEDGAADETRSLVERALEGKKDKQEEVLTDETGTYSYVLLPDGTAEIREYRNRKKNKALGMTIPEQLDGYPVSSIGDSAFYKCAKVREITVPETVRSIGKSAFGNCISLRKITLPASLESIGEIVFRECSKLEEIAFSSENRFYETVDGALISKRDHSLICFPLGLKARSYTVPDGILAIGTYAFEENPYIQEVVLPDSLQSISLGAFILCGKLKSVSLPENLKEIGNSAFMSTALTEITIPESVEKLGNYVFLGSKLKRVTFPGSLKVVPASAFCGCRDLKSVVISPGVAIIGADAFYNCRKLSSAELPDSLKSIGNRSFGNCDSLKKITLPAGVNSIDEDAFVRRGKIQITVFAGSYAEEYLRQKKHKYINLVTVE